MFTRKMKAKEDVLVGMKYVEVSMRANFEFIIELR